MMDLEERIEGLPELALTFREPQPEDAYRQMMAKRLSTLSVNAGAALFLTKAQDLRLLVEVVLSPGALLWPGNPSLQQAQKYGLIDLRFRPTPVGEVMAAYPTAAGIEVAGLLLIKDREYSAGAMLDGSKLGPTFDGMRFSPRLRLLPILAQGAELFEADIPELHKIKSWDRDLVRETTDGWGLDWAGLSDVQSMVVAYWPPPTCKIRSVEVHDG